MKRNSWWTYVVFGGCFLIGLLRLAADKVDIDKLLEAETDMAHQAGMEDTDRKFLQVLEGAAMSKGLRAEIARRRCSLEVAVQGPTSFTMNLCRSAWEAGQAAGGERERRAGRKLGMVLTMAGQAQEALKILNGLAPYQGDDDPIEEAMTLWAKAHTQAALGRFDLAATIALDARSCVMRAVQKKSERAEFLTLADWEYGRALAALGRHEEAERAYLIALPRQIQLHRESAGYVEYLLYLTRITRDLGRLPGHEKDAAEAARLAGELHARQPERWEYNAGL